MRAYIDKSGKNAKLKPCPTCRSKISDLVEYIEITPFSRRWYVSCQLDSCRFRGPQHLDAPSAVTAWNELNRTRKVTR